MQNKIFETVEFIEDINQINVNQRLIKYSLLFLLAFSSLSFQQQQNFDPNAKVKAVFLYNFTRYFEWPEKMKSGNFIIHIMKSC